jgi:hypothetical protein
MVSVTRPALMKKSRFLFFFLVLVFSACAGSEVRIIDIHVTVGESLLLSFAVTNTFLRDTRKAIDTGTKVTHTYAIDLYEVRRFWWDQEITTVEVRHDIEYDNLKQVYLVTISEENSKTISLKDFAEAMKLMSETLNLEVAELHKLTKGKPYKVRIAAQLEKGQPPSLWNRGVVFFLSLDGFSSGSCTVTFRY